ncbi:MAG: CvpA family protein [Bacteroidales bacterium]|nr:CvpA family protein [Bacteroidales bacterium]
MDIILLICFIPAVIQGIRNGFIAQVISIAALILGVWASARFTPEVSTWLAQYITVSDQVMKVISFTAILLMSFLVLALIGKFLEATFKLVMLGWLNSLLGAVFSLIKAGLVIGLVIMAFCSLNNTFDFVSEEVLNESVLFPPLKKMAYTVFPYLKELLFWNK